MSTIVVASAIGGAGKTTASLCIAAALAKIEADTMPTVLIDLDPAGDASRRMGLTREGDVLGRLLDGRLRSDDAMGGFTVLDAAKKTPEGFAMVPSSDYIGVTEARFSAMVGGTALLIYRLRALGRSCRLVIDTAPGITAFLCRAAIAAADVVVIPVIPGPGAVRGVLDVVSLLRGMACNAHVLVVAAQTDGTASGVADVNDGLRNVQLTVSEWFPSEPAVAQSAVEIGSPLARLPDSLCAHAYVRLADRIEKVVVHNERVTRARAGHRDYPAGGFRVNANAG